MAHGGSWFAAAGNWHASSGGKDFEGVYPRTRVEKACQARIAERTDARCSRDPNLSWKVDEASASNDPLGECAKRWISAMGPGIVPTARS